MRKHSVHIGTMGVLHGVMQMFHGMTHLRDVRFYADSSKKELHSADGLCDEIASQLDAAYQRGYVDGKAEAAKNGGAE